jgi:hypothetical protein
MTDVENYQEIINKFKLFDHDPIQFYININTNESDKIDEKCVICLESNITLKIKCCEGYFHNSCLYKTIKYKNKKINLEYKIISYLNEKHEILTNNINETCPICRQYLSNCDIIKPTILQPQRPLQMSSFPRFPHSNFSFGSSPRVPNGRFGTVQVSTSNTRFEVVPNPFISTPSSTPSGFGSTSSSTPIDSSIVNFTFGSFPRIDNNIIRNNDNSIFRSNSFTFN